MTTTGCVIQLLSDWQPGTEMYGYEICDVVNARMADEHKRPLESTILRRLREHAAEYKIHTVGGSESRYLKESADVSHKH